MRKNVLNGAWRPVLILAVVGVFVVSLAGLGLAQQTPQKKPRTGAAVTPPPAVEPQSMKPGKGSMELSTSAYLEIESVSFEGESESGTTIGLPLRFGYFLTSSISVEPEVNFSVYSTTGYSATGGTIFANVLYHFSLSSPIMPFVLGGVGLRLDSMSIEGESASESKLAFNGGVGMKWFASKGVALRVEYRFVFMSKTPEGAESSMKTMYHRLLTGISIFF